MKCLEDFPEGDEKHDMEGILKKNDEVKFDIADG